LAFIISNYSSLKAEEFLGQKIIKNAKNISQLSENGLELIY
jgi:hypothetical protein